MNTFFYLCILTYIISFNKVYKLPCIGIFDLVCIPIIVGRLILPPPDPPLPPAAICCGIAPLLAASADDVDGPPFRRLFEATLVRGGLCVEVVILVNVYGGKLSSISESIMRAMCWKPDDVGLGLLWKRHKGIIGGGKGEWEKCQSKINRTCVFCLVCIWVDNNIQMERKI